MFRKRNSRSARRDLSGKQVYITGAARGIGRATAELAAAEGAVVHLTDRNEAPLLEVAEQIRAIAGDVGLVEAVDVRDYEPVRRLAAGLSAQHRAIDLVTNIHVLSHCVPIPPLPRR